MKFLVDVGNTTTRSAFYDGEELIEPRSIATRTRRTADEWWMVWKNLYGDQMVTGVEPIVISVVPEVTHTLRRLMRKQFSEQFQLLDSPWDGPVGFGRPDAGEVGTDRYAGAVGLVQKYNYGIVVDFGTATTVDVVDAEHQYQGGFIYPGVETGLKGLQERTSLLPGVDLEEPPETYSTGTREALRGGLFFGNSGAVDRMVRLLREEHEFSPDVPVVATGGYGEEFVEICEEISEIESNLVLEGLSTLG